MFSVILLGITTQQTFKPELMTYLQIFASVSALLSSYLIIKGKRSNFIWSIFNCIVWAIIAYNSHLYFDALLQIFYIATSFIGLYKWDKIITYEDKKINFKIIIPITIGMTSLAFFIKDTSPVLDTFNLVFSVVSQLTLLNKDYKTFIIWIVSDIVMFFAYINQPIMAATYVSYTFIAIIGLIQYFDQKQKSLEKSA